MSVKTRLSFHLQVNLPILLPVVFLLFFKPIFAQQPNLAEFLPEIKVNDLTQYGFKPFIKAGENKQSVEFSTSSSNKRIYFLEYLLVNKSENGSENFFNYIEDNSEYENAGPQPAERAVINIGYWGISPSTDQSAVYAKPSLTKDVKIKNLFKDVLGAVPDYFTGSESVSDLHLLFYYLMPKTGKAYNDFKNEVNTLHSLCIYILWDKGKEPQLPELLSDKLFLDIPLQQPVSSVKPMVTISVNGITSPLTYSLVNYKAETVTSTLTGEDLTFPLFNKNKPTPGAPMKMIIDKPRGYNLTRIYEEDTLDWINDKVEIPLEKAEKISLVLHKLAPFYLIFIDLSGFEDKAKLKVYLNEKMAYCYDKPYLMYLCKGENPMIARQGEAYKTILSRLFALNPETPLGSEATRLRNILDIPKVLSRNNLNLFLFLSQTFIGISYATFTEKFYENINPSQVECTIFTSYDEKKQKEKVHYININN
ncbi:MAG: hypothetical protein NTU44_06275 [Bacteroidetes bacterium]|nr:hypothetical protein [Bacteroidota bacterium]